MISILNEKSHLLVWGEPFTRQLKCWLEFIHMRLNHFEWIFTTTDGTLDMETFKGDLCTFSSKKALALVRKSLRRYPSFWKANVQQRGLPNLRILDNTKITIAPSVDKG